MCAIWRLKEAENQLAFPVRLWVVAWRAARCPKRRWSFACPKLGCECMCVVSGVCGYGRSHVDGRNASGVQRCDIYPTRVAVLELEPDSLRPLCRGCAWKDRGDSVGSADVLST